MKPTCYANKTGLAISEKLNAYKFRFISLITLLVFLTVIFLSCENKINLLPKPDFLTHPSLTVKDFRSETYDSGKLQLILISPLLEQYDNIALPYWEFSSGIKAVFYDGKTESVTSVTAKYAKYTKTNKMWELKESVVVINESNTKLETEVLNWDQEKDLIFTDRFVKITNEDQISQGFGFESDLRGVKRRIKKPSGIFYLKEEE